MTCVILQPSYIPWRGYFDQIHRADVFVFLDCAQYDRRGWRHRNRIKTPQGPKWLSIPVHARGAQQTGLPIHEVRICWDRDWPQKHWEAIRRSYGSAAHFDRYAPQLEAFYRQRPVYLADWTIELTRWLAGELGIQPPRYLRSSQLPGVRGQKTERLLSILQQVEAEHYLSGPSAAAYLDEDLLARHAIRVEYMEYNYPEYPQRFPPFDPQVSILDLLFTHGPQASQYIWGADAG